MDVFPEGVGRWATNVTLPCGPCISGIRVNLRDLGLDFVWPLLEGYTHLWDSERRFGDGAYMSAASFEGYASLIKSV